MEKNDLQELRTLMELTWRKRNGQPDNKMVDHCMHSGKYIKIDNIFISVCDAKPAITKTIWYDDEREGPEANWENFKAMNERLNMPKTWELNYRHTNPLYIRVQYWRDNTEGRLAALEYVAEDREEKDGLIRKVTPEDLQKINAAVEEVRQDYTNRLERYYKRFGKDHVASQGCWRDR